MKAVKITLAGRTQYLAYTGEAMFQLQEKFGTAAELLGAIGKNTRDGLSVACEAAAILAEQGELARRHLGYDKGPIIEAATIDLALRRAQRLEELEQLRKSLSELLDRHTFGQRRLLRAFPQMRSIDHKQALERLRQRQKERQEKKGGSV